MLLVGINGSPNKNGNTAWLLNKVLETAAGKGAETRILHAGELVMTGRQPFCTVCSNPCNGSCYKDSLLEEGFDIMRKADGIVVGSPVYYGTVSAQLKALFDRTRFLRMEKALYNKVGAAVTVAAARFGGQETTIKAIHDIMLVHGMMILGDGYVEADCGHHGVAAQRPAEEDGTALLRAEILGKRLVEVCKKMG